MKTRIIRESVIPLTIGLLTAMLLQMTGGWWLDSGRGVATTMAVLFGTAIGVCLRSDAPRLQATAMCIGAIAGMTAVLFWIGPGTIWPIVLVVAAALTCTAVYAGAGVARLVRRRR
jgi:hypothetical protein